MFLSFNHNCAKIISRHTVYAAVQVFEQYQSGKLQLESMVAGAERALGACALLTVRCGFQPWFDGLLVTLCYCKTRNICILLCIVPIHAVICALYCSALFSCFGAVPRPNQLNVTIVLRFNCLRRHSEHALCNVPQATSPLGGATSGPCRNTSRPQQQVSIFAC